MAYFRKRIKKICNFCNQEFMARTDSLGKFCSRSCSSKYNKTIHGLSNDPIYKIYMGMKTRCYNTQSPDYKYYGQKGIEICNEWLRNFNKFYKWCISNGYRKSLQIDRINNDGNYEPKNCRFTTSSINLINRSLMKNNTSGYKGVCYEKQTGQWKVCFKGKTICRVDNIQQAILKRKEVENVRLFP